MSDSSLSEHVDNANNGYYSQHLAEVTEKGNGTHATCDIFSEQGHLLVRKGVSIDTRIAGKLLKHKLLKPLCAQVGLETQLDAAALLSHCDLLRNKYPDVGVIHSALKFAGEFEALVRQSQLHPIIAQKLTVLNSEMTHEFEKALFCAWLATLTAREMGLDKQAQQDTLLAGLVHDIGLMNLDPGIVNAKGQLTPEQWKTLQAHVVIGKIIVDTVEDVSPEVSRAVVEHHETCFGSGYPFSISGYERCTVGRLIGKADSIHAIRVNNFATEQRTLGDIVPYLQLNKTTQSEDVYRATISIIKKSGLKPNPVQPEVPLGIYAGRLGMKTDILADVTDELTRINSRLTEAPGMSVSNPQLSTIRAILPRFLAQVCESGLLTEYHVNWLIETSQNPHAALLTDLNEIELLVNELTWQLRNTIRMLYACQTIADPSTQDNSAFIKTSIAAIQSNLDSLQALKMTG